MGHLRDGTETEVTQLKAKIKQQEDMLAQKASEIADPSFERDALQGASKTKGETAEKLTRSPGAILSICNRLRDRLLRNGLRRSIANLVWLRRHNRPPGERPTIVPRSIPAPTTSVGFSRGDANNRLICVSHVLPYPSRAGNEYRIHRILTWLSGQGFDVFLIVCPPPGVSITMRMLADACSVYPNLIVCQRDGALLYRLAEGEMFVKKMAGVRPRAFAPLLGEENSSPISPKVLSITRMFCPDLLTEVLQQLDRMLKPRILWINYVWMTRALPLMRREVLKVVDTHDVFSTKCEKVAPFGIEDPFTLTPEEETHLLNRADLVVSIQSGEEETLRRMAPRKRIVTAGVDFDPVDCTSVSSQSPVVLLIASDNPLNVKGLADFLRFAWPIIRRDVPGAELRVVGGVGAQMELDDPTVRFMGRIDDLEVAYAEARVVINPAIAGTGLKIKTVEAIFHLRPIVCWPSGVDGIESDLQALCRIAKDWQSFARHVIDLCYRDESDNALLEQRNQIRTQFSADNIYRALGQSLSELLAESRRSPHAVSADASNRADGDL